MNAISAKISPAPRKLPTICETCKTRFQPRQKCWVWNPPAIKVVLGLDSVRILCDPCYQERIKGVEASSCMTELS